MHTTPNIGQIGHVTKKNILKVLNKIFYEGFTTGILSYAAEYRTIIVRLSHHFWIFLFLPLPFVRQAYDEFEIGLNDSYK